jgi:glycosyltransferase involved in cell wall biosynthesis
MTQIINKLSVFFPAYNEEKNIETTVLKAKKVLLKIAQTWEILIINDGSKDETLEISQNLVRKDKRIKVINHKVNRGYGAALKTGLYAAKYPWIAFTDADGQFDFGEIIKFIQTQKQTEADLVIGKYINRQVSLGRKLNTFIWETVINLLFNLGVRDIDTGFKLVSKKVIQTIPKLESERGAFIESEFLIKAKKAGFKIVQIGVKHYPRKAGVATGAKFEVIVKSFIDLFKLWKKLN